MPASLVPGSTAGRRHSSCGTADKAACTQEETRAQALQQVSDERLEAAVQQGLSEARTRQSAPGLPDPAGGEVREADFRDAAEDAGRGTEQRELEPSNK